MRSFLVIGHKFRGEVNLNDLPGSGRIDVIARCINSAIFLSHNIRRDVMFFVYFPRIGIRVKIDSSRVKYLNPDERSTSALIRNAVLNVREEEKRASPGFYVRYATLKDTLLEIEKHGKVYYLHEEGKDIRHESFSGDTSFILSDSVDLDYDEEKMVDDIALSRISVGPRSILASHAITIVNNELDRRGL